MLHIHNDIQTIKVFVFFVLFLLRSYLRKPVCPVDRLPLSREKVFNHARMRDSHFGTGAIRKVLR